VIDAIADRLQFDMQEIRNRLTILEALVLPIASEIAHVVHPAPEISGKESLPLPEPPT
jgi:hypothetical protein